MPAHAARRASVTSDITIEGRTEIHLPGSTGGTPLPQENSPLPPDPSDDNPLAGLLDTPGVHTTTGEGNANANASSPDKLEALGRTSS